MTRRTAVFPNLTRLALSLLVTLTLIVPIAYIAAPHLHRWVMLNQLTAQDAGDWRAALQYVRQHAGREPDVREQAIERLTTLNDTRFRQLVRVLDRAGVWTRQNAGDQTWLRWVTLLSESSQTANQQAALTELAKLPTHANDRRVIQTIERFITHGSAAVRETSLKTATLLYPAAQPKAPYISIFGQAIRDDAPRIARRAWIVLGLIEPKRGFPANWRTAPPSVAEAILWAVGRTNPSSKTVLIEAARDAPTPPRVRAMALYALAVNQHPNALTATVGSLFDSDGGKKSTPRPAILMHRAMRVLDHGPADALPWLKNITPDALIERLDAQLKRVTHNPAQHAASTQSTANNGPKSERGQRRGSNHNACVNAALHALAGRLTNPTAFINRATADSRRRLAVLEGLNEPLDRMQIDADMPPLLRIASVKAAHDPQAGWLEPVWSTDSPPLRDLACAVAARRFDRTTRAALIERLLNDLNDHHKQAGAIIAGLTGQQTELLQKRMTEENVWAVRVLMQVALWMQDEQNKGQSPIPLLQRRDLPRSTLLLALLHRKPTRALNHVFQDPGYSDQALMRFFDHHRAWQVWRPHLPSDAPRFWLWADSTLQRFQVQVLRQWYRLHHHRLTGQKAGP
jgi:hypothetical protein